MTKPQKIEGGTTTPIQDSPFAFDPSSKVLDKPDDFVYSPEEWKDPTPTQDKKKCKHSWRQLTNNGSTTYINGQEQYDFYCTKCLKIKGKTRPYQNYHHPNTRDMAT